MEAWAPPDCADRRLEVVAVVNPFHSIRVHISLIFSVFAFRLLLYGI